MWVSSSQVQTLKNRIEELLTTIREIEDRPYLIGVERQGKKNKFIFVRKNKVIEVETVGLMSDNIKGWKDDLLR